MAREGGPCSSTFPTLACEAGPYPNETVPGWSQATPLQATHGGPHRSRQSLLLGPGFVTLGGDDLGGGSARRLLRYGPYDPLLWGSRG